MQAESTQFFSVADQILDDVIFRFRSALRLEGTKSSIRHLSRLLSTAKFSRTVERIRSPRRLLLTVAAFLLGLVWLGQAVFGIMLRSPASSTELMSWIPFSLTIYFSWNFIKIAGQKPVEPFEWTETERELLIGSPLKRSEIIQYRCHTIARSALIKSLIFSFVMIPDLNFLPLGFLGILAALIFIELSRCITEIIVYGANKTELILFRVAVFGIIAIVAGRALVCTIVGADFGQQIETAASFGFLLSLLDAIKEQTSAWYGVAFLAPFRFATQVIIADRINMMTIFQLCSCGLVVVALNAVIPALESLVRNRRIRIDKCNFDKLQMSNTLAVDSLLPDTKIVRRPRRVFGAGTLMWRQWQGALGYRYSLMVSLLIPAILACMPAFSGVNDFALVANTVGALAFYSMVLLPASLKFDFRRDVDRIHVLKSMPLSPFWLTIGQLTVPIALTTVFQISSLSLVWLISPYNPLYLLGGIVVLFPFTVFIFCFENLAFLWYPYRMNQEGMQVLIRSILVFTAKSLVFALAFATTFVWVLVSRYIAESVSPTIATATIFASGMFVMSSAVSIIVFCALTNAFRRFDASSDLVGLD